MVLCNGTHKKVKLKRIKYKQLNVNEKNGFPFLSWTIQSKSHLLGLRKGREECVWRGWWPGWRGQGRPGWWHHGLDAKNKCTENLGSRVSQCQRIRNMAREKTRMNPIVNGVNLFSAHRQISKCTYAWVCECVWVCPSTPWEHRVHRTCRSRA